MPEHLQQRSLPQFGHRGVSPIRRHNFASHFMGIKDSFSERLECLRLAPHGHLSSPGTAGNLSRQSSSQRNKRSLPMSFRLYAWPRLRSGF